MWFRVKGTTPVARATGMVGCRLVQLGFVNIFKSSVCIRCVHHCLLLLFVVVVVDVLALKLV